MDRLDAFRQVKEVGVIPAIRAPNEDDVIKAVEAIRLGGIAVIEISLAPKKALDVLGAVAASHGPSMLIGAGSGSVVNAEGVRQAALVGARFIVTPGFSPEAVKKAQELDPAVFAGAMKPTEVQLAALSKGVARTISRH